MTNIPLRVSHERLSERPGRRTVDRRRHLVGQCGSRDGVDWWTTGRRGSVVWVDVAARWMIESDSSSLVWQASLSAPPGRRRRRGSGTDAAWSAAGSAAAAVAAVACLSSTSGSRWSTV